MTPRLRIAAEWRKSSDTSHRVITSAGFDPNPKHFRNIQPDVGVNPPTPTPLKPRPLLPAPHWLTCATAAAATLAASDRLLATPTLEASAFSKASPDASARFAFNYEQVLGTSLDVRLGGTSSRDAREAESRIMTEIRRLEKILSTYDRASEINRVKAGAPIESAELAEVLAAYELWSARTGGAVSGNLAEVISLWKTFAAGGPPPTSAALAEAFARPRAFNLDALGKGYVVDRAVEVARRLAASGMINIGGDLRVWGDHPWMVGIADPRSPADNAAPLLHFPLREGAVATSADYARSYDAGGRRYSHLIDPRTLRPSNERLSTTVVASDCLTANALAAAAAVLGTVEGTTLARTYGLDHLFFAAAAPSTASSAAATVSQTSSVTANSTWPAGFQVNVSVALKSPDGGRYKRPYVAVWVETPNRKVVRTLSIWGRQGRYLPELTNWWHATGGDRSVIDAVSRATRQAGSYTLAWDGLDDHGAPVPPGDYKIFVEINREHGHHILESIALKCSIEPATAELGATAESVASPVKYGPKPDLP